MVLEQVLLSISIVFHREKCKYVAQELCLFVQKRQFTDFCTVNTWTRHQRSLSTFTFNFLELSNDTFNDSSFFNRPYFVPIITKEPVWFSSILFYCQLASYRWRTFVNSVNYKTLRTICQNHDIPPSFLLLKYDHEWRSISKKKSWRTWNSTFLDGGCDFSKSSSISCSWIDDDEWGVAEITCRLKYQNFIWR